MNDEHDDYQFLALFQWRKHTTIKHTDAKMNKKRTNLFFFYHLNPLFFVFNNFNFSMMVVH